LDFEHLNKATFCWWQYFGALDRPCLQVFGSPISFLFTPVDALHLSFSQTQKSSVSYKYIDSHAQLILSLSVALSYYPFRSAYRSQWLSSNSPEIQPQDLAGLPVIFALGHILTTLHSPAGVRV
jgi:hypothetical protein